MSFFLAQGYARAGTASRHYRADIDEVMLYKSVEHDGMFPEERIIPVRPMEKQDEQQVRHLVISRLSPHFNGIVEIADVRIYPTFAEMLKHEKAGHIVPDDPTGAPNILRGIYPKEKEDLGVYVFQLRVIKRATSN